MWGRLAACPTLANSLRLFQPQHGTQAWGRHFPFIQKERLEQRQEARVEYAAVIAHDRRRHLHGPVRSVIPSPRLLADPVSQRPRSDLNGFSKVSRLSRRIQV